MKAKPGVPGIVLPVKLRSTVNLREHWRVRAARARTARHTAALVVRAHLAHLWGIHPAGVLRVRLTWVHHRLADTDNLASAFKAVRDGIADAFGLDDGDRRLVWEYRQERGAPQVRVEVLAYNARLEDEHRRAVDAANQKLERSAAHLLGARRTRGAK